MKKPIPEWEDKYLAGDDGLIYSIATGNPMYTIEDKNGYLIVQLFRDKKRHTRAVHRLIAISYLGEKPKDHFTVNHIDGIKKNNVPSNLEYVDRSDQMYHAYRLGLKKPVRANQKLTEEQVRLIRRRYGLGGRGNGAYSIAKWYGVSESTILNIVNGRTYQWVES